MLGRCGTRDLPATAATLSVASTENFAAVASHFSPVVRAALALRSTAFFHAGARLGLENGGRPRRDDHRGTPDHLVEVQPLVQKTMPDTTDSGGCRTNRVAPTVGSVWAEPSNASSRRQPTVIHPGMKSILSQTAPAIRPTIPPVMPAAAVTIGTFKLGCPAPLGRVAMKHPSRFGEVSAFE